ncbi:methylisocitrate lyase-like protein [Dothidotthia symphoricarpi CBS 119687]|uniref:Methylisocitrate lyase-like protein n=1 Tax=Dothidotthia symphoricarpi CBS 119687 TaxID=1392245 RepID=A0A6A6A6G9_9PLEO|nr:methylisocitrate lyase-like protein [Dothidotthia symphoricarpi CBS 119687]KAF2126785.1 methylisocitrate lyase-like protein [Dothidotthia symphoricarpi CBS 119687]
MGSNGTSTGGRRKTAVETLRAMLADPDKFIACPGVYDGFTARIALQEGADCLYMTGAGTTMSRLGMADMGIATLNDMLSNASMIANLDPSVPLIADADTGYGGPIMAGRTTTAYIRAGIAGLHLEDQIATKRCGHLNGKQLVSTAEYASRIKAAVLAREQSGGDIVIIARTDALQGFGYDEAIKRLKVAVAEGADAAFLEGVNTREEAERACKDLAPTPCLFNNVPGGVSPDFGVEECKDIGYRIAIFPCLAFEVVYPAVRKAMQQLNTIGNVKSVEKDGRRYGPRELFAVCGLDDMIEFDAQAGGTAYTDA